jgi:hypothetical protein
MARIDTHQLVKDLIECGFPEKASEVLGKAFFISNNSESFVTKEQFGHLEKEQGDIKTELAVIKQTMATKTDIAELRTELKSDMFKGIISLLIVMVTLIVPLWFK